MSWYLERRGEEGQEAYSVPLVPLPFRIGRKWDLPLVLPLPFISWEHAEIFAVGDSLKVRDLGSRNGTFVSGQRVVGEAPLSDGDSLRLGVLELRVGRDLSAGKLRSITAGFSSNSVPRGLLEQALAFSELMQQEAVEVHFQPIVNLHDIQRGLPKAFEVLGRGCHRGLPRSPWDLLEVASHLGAAAELSQLFRRRGIEDALAHLPGAARLFLNAHPAELERPERLLEALSDLRRRAPGLQLTLEVHEGTITSIAAMRALRDHLHELGIQLAYDDFGVGQSRLVEVAEVPPDFLKFDAALVEGVKRSPTAHQPVLTSMLRMAADLGISTIAEGVETREILERCRELGFDAAQGYHCGFPVPAASFDDGTLCL